MKTPSGASSVTRRIDGRMGRRIGMLAAVAYFVAVAVAAATFVNFHDFGGYAHGLADGDNNNGMVRNYNHRDSGGNGYLFTRRLQSGSLLSTDACTCPTVDRYIYPSINECHESMWAHAESPAMGVHEHFHANYCG